MATPISAVGGIIHEPLPFLTFLFILIAVRVSPSDGANGRQVHGLESAHANAQSLVSSHTPIPPPPSPPGRGGEGGMHNNYMGLPLG